MDCKDLMINDFVYVIRGYDKHLTIEKIKGVIADKDEPYPVTIFTGETVSLNDIEPIPLTEDILVKNGWRKEPITIDGDYANWHGEIPISQAEDEFNYADIELRYAHQLQHLLRLWGIEKELTI
jgi:hypothetical protein